MKPLADSQTRHKGIRRKLWRTIFAKQAHIVVPVIRTTLCLFVAGGRGPRGGKVEEAIPVDPLRDWKQQLRRSLDAERLNLLSPEGRHARFGHPDGFVSYSPNLIKFLGPFMNGPVIPIQRKPMHRNNVHGIENAIAGHELHEFGIDGRNTAKGYSKCRIYFPDGGSCEQ